MHGADVMRMSLIIEQISKEAFPLNQGNFSGFSVKGQRLQSGLNCSGDRSPVIHVGKTAEFLKKFLIGKAIFPLKNSTGSFN